MNEVENRLGVPLPQTQECLMMDWADAHQLLAEGHEIGAHTVDHPDLAMIGSDEVCAQLSGCYKLIKDRVGVAPLHFAYPNPILKPDVPQHVRKLVQEAGYHTAVSAQTVLTKASEDSLSMPRLPAMEGSDEFGWQLFRSMTGGRV